jgi:hypothetical protein
MTSLAGAGEITWSVFWQSSLNRRYFLLAMCSLALMFAAMFFTLAHIELREGIVIETGAGPLLGAPRDFSVPIFIFTYGSIVSAISTTVARPVLFLRLLTAYVLMQLIRCLVLLAVPLDPPSDILPLNDPLLESSFYNGRVNVKDLFFSGHVATIAVVALCARGKWTRILFWSVATLTAFMLAQQRVHYIIDVLSAPLFAWLAVKLAAVISRPLASSSS